MQFCELKTSRYRTQPSRSDCGRPGSLWNVFGLLTATRLVLCSEHRRTLERLGLKVEKALPLEVQLAAADKRLQDVTG